MLSAKPLVALTCWLALVLALSLVWSGYKKTDAALFIPHHDIKQKHKSPFYRETFIFRDGFNAYNHASSVTELADGSILAVWYGGSREGAADVKLFQSLLRPNTGNWTEPEALITPDMVSRDLARYVQKIGNPVLHVDNKNRVWVFFVTVSVGGWSGSSLNYIISEDQGKHWSTTKRLNTSPFFNVSTLVKGQPFNFHDGSIGLPVYHELMGKFGELLRIDNKGSILSKYRISFGRKSLQPSIAVLDEKNALVLMRYTGASPRRILAATTRDGGITWSDAKKLSLPNPNSGLMVRNADNTLLLVFNNTEHGRHILSLATSHDKGRHWKVIHDFEHSSAESKDRFSYPYFIRSGNGNYHLTYTWKKHRIKHVIFNDSWIKSREKS